MNRKYFKYRNIPSLIKIIFPLILLVVACKKEPDKITEAYEDVKEVLPVSLDDNQTSVPSSGAAGTLVSFKVKGLEPYKSQMEFKFNGEIAQVISLEDSILTVEVPPYASTGVTSISIGDIVIFGPNFTVEGDLNIDNTFTIHEGANGAVNHIFKTSDDKYIYLGAFTNFDEKGIINSINRIARTYEDGSYDATFRFGKGANGALNMGLEMDNKLYIAGSFSGYDQRSQDISNITRLNSNGTIDTMGIHTFRRPDQNDTIKYYPTFNGGVGGGSISKVYKHMDKLLISGSFTEYINRTYDKANRLETKDTIIVNRTDMYQIALLNLDGSLDKSYRFNQTTGKGLTAGNGSIDTYYHEDGNLSGKLVVFGSFTKFDNSAANYLIRLNADGTQDLTFNAGGVGPDYVVSNVTYNKNTKKYLICGNFKHYNGKEVKTMALLNEDGTLDESFNPKEFENGQPTFAKQLDDGLIIVSGSFLRYNSVSRRGFLIIDSKGDMIAKYNTMGNCSGGIMNLYETTSEDGRRALLIIGNMSSFDGANVNNIFRVVLD